MKTKQQLLTDLAGSFEARTRTNGNTYYVLHGTGPAWFDMHAIHSDLDDRLPCDWIYETVYDFASIAAGYDEPEAFEIAQTLSTRLSTHDLLEWTADHSGNQSYVEEAMADCTCDSLDKALRCGYELAVDQIAASVLAQVDVAFEDQEGEE